MATSKTTGNTFASYQEQKQQRRERLIEAYLVVARKSRQKYEYVTDLAKAVANHISVNEMRDGVADSDCNPSTLLRNQRYKSLLLSYLADSMSAGIKNSNKSSVLLSPTEKSTALLSQLETSNLRLENQRLKYHIAELEKALTAECAAEVKVISLYTSRPWPGTRTKKSLTFKALPEGLVNLSEIAFTL